MRLLRQHRGEVAVSLVLLSLVVVAFWPVAFGSRSFFSTDLLYEHLPIWHQVQKSLAEGNSPFWLDGHYMGSPLLFTQEAPVFYPLMVPALLLKLPVHRTADLLSLFHFWLAGMGAFLFSKRVTGSLLAGAFAGCGWMLCGRLVHSVMWPNSVAVHALLPFALWGVWELSRGHSRSGLLLATLAGGCIILSARPHTVLGALPFLAAVFLTLLFTAADRKRFVLETALSAILAVAIGAPSLLPSLLIYPQTERFGGLPQDRRDEGALSRVELDQILLPIDGLRRWPEPASYPGFVVVALFLCGLAWSVLRPGRIPRGLMLILLTSGVVGFAFAFGDSGPYRWFSGLPVLSGFRTPVRFLLSMSLALLTGAVLTLAAIERSGERGTKLASLLTAVLAIELSIQARFSVPAVPSELMGAKPALAAYLERMPSDPLGFHPRFWSFGMQPPFAFLSYPRMLESFRRSDHLMLALGMRFGLFAVNGAGPVLRRTEAFTRLPSLRTASMAGVTRLILPAPGSLAEDREAPPLPAILADIEAKGVRPYVPPFRVVRGEDVVPRAVVVRAVTRVPGLPEGLAAVTSPSFDPLRMAVVEDETGLPQVDAGGPPARVQRLEERPGLVVLGVESAGPGLLVLFDAFEESWTARVNGESRPVLPVDVAFRGVVLSGGRERVEFRYAPAGVLPGLLLLLLAVTGLGLAIRRGPSSGTPRPGG